MKNVYYLFLALLISCTPGKEKDELKYLPFSKSVVHLNVKNHFPDTINVQANANTNIPSSGVRSNELAIKNGGNYYLTIEIDRPSKGSLRIQEDEYNIIVFPNDTTQIELDSNQGDLEINFSGPGKSINEYFYEKRKSFGYTDIRRPLGKTIAVNSTYNSIKNAVDSIINQELLFLEKYKSSNSLPKWFIDYETANVVYLGAGFKITRPDYNKRRKLFKDTIPDDYFSFLDDLEIDN